MATTAQRMWRILETLVTLKPGDPNFPTFLTDLQNRAALVLSGEPLKPGNPAFKTARLKGIAVRRQQTENLRAQVQPLIQKYLAEGLSLGQIAEKLNTTAFRPLRSEIWTRNTVHSIKATFI